MRFDDYVKSLGGSVSEVKEKILRKLWDEGRSFPRGWVRSSALLALTRQKYFDRRVRELRDELGCDIETGTAGGEHAYRLRSTRVDVANPRGYLSESQKRQLFENAKHRCAVCGGQFEAGLRGLQADHKIPLKRGGQHGEENWQPLCVECNVGKRRACAGCNLECRKCPWAFPDQVGKRIVLALPADIDGAARERAARTGKSVHQVMLDAIQLVFAKREL
jgi:5-methylcytosine-specific restriction endonuclease McrA